VKKHHPKPGPVNQQRNDRYCPSFSHGELSFLARRKTRVPTIVWPTLCTLLLFGSPFVLKNRIWPNFAPPSKGPWEPEGVVGWAGLIPLSLTIAPQGAVGGNIDEMHLANHLVMQDWFKMAGRIAGKMVEKTRFGVNPKQVA
jgi:hypothetical protein